MVAEIDTTEARRKALRNGEEDPVVVAQRFLNIYRQMHIFSAERKEAFDKMLLELSPSIRGIFGSLPGGAILQDYVDDLAEKAGVEKSSQSSENMSLDNEANQQAQILATALAKAQSQTPSAPIGSGTAKLSMDENFAGEFAKIIGNIFQEQAISQKSSIEKLASDLSKTQLFIAKTLKENKDEQRAEVGVLCKAIIKSQTALSSSLTSAIAMQTDSSSKNENETKQLIENVLDNQKQLNIRIDKVEELSAAKANDNIKLIEVFEKSQAEIIKGLSNLQSNNSITISRTDEDDERLVKLISQSQESLIKTVMATNLQQNNNSATQNNNANNIQINTTDSSGHLMLLVEKIATLQAANEKNLEKAIVKAIEAQSKIYDKISRKQTEKLAEVIAEGLRSNAGNTCISQPTADSSTQELSSISTIDNDYHVNNTFNSLPQADEDSTIFNDIVDMSNQEVSNVDYNASETLQEESSLIEDNVVVLADETPKKKKKRKKKKKNALDNPIQTNEEELIDLTSFQDVSPIHADVVTNSEILEDDIEIVLPTQDFSVEETLLDGQAAETEDVALASTFEDSQENTSNNELVDYPNDSVFENDNKKYFDTTQVEETIDEWKENNSVADELSKDDWGFGEDKPVESSNDNIEGQDWEWVYVEDDNNTGYLEVEAIGDNSFIYQGDLYTQERFFSNEQIVSGSSPVYVKNKLQVYDEAEDQEFIDPYKNSILKD